MKFRFIQTIIKTYPLFNEDPFKQIQDLGKKKYNENKIIQSLMEKNTDLRYYAFCFFSLCNRILEQNTHMKSILTAMSTIFGRKVQIIFWSVCPIEVLQVKIFLIVKFDFCSTHV